MFSEIVSLLLSCHIVLLFIFFSMCPNRSELSLQPVLEDNDQDEQFECSEGFSYEDVSVEQPDKPLRQTCRCHGGQGGVLMVNMVPVKDAVTFKHTGDVGENFDVPFVLHLWPSILLRNLLPYPISYTLKVRCVTSSLLICPFFLCALHIKRTHSQVCTSKWCNENIKCLWLLDCINYRLLCYTLIAMLRFPYCSIGQWSRCSWSHSESRPLCSALHCSNQPIQCWPLSSELLRSGLVVQVQVWIILFVFCCPCFLLLVRTNHVLLIRPQQEKKCSLDYYH